jgi:hypothetical protein
MMVFSNARIGKGSEFRLHQVIGCLLCKFNRTHNSLSASVGKSELQIVHRNQPATLPIEMLFAMTSVLTHLILVVARWSLRPQQHLQIVGGTTWLSGHLIHR